MKMILDGIIKYIKFKKIILDLNPLVKYLKENKVLSQEQISEVERHVLSGTAWQDWESFLVNKKIFTEKEFLNIKSQILKLPVVDLKNTDIKKDILELVPEPIASKYKVVAFAKDAKCLSLAMFDPGDIQVKEFISKRTGLAIKPFLTDSASLHYVLAKYHDNLEHEMASLMKASGFKNGALNESLVGFGEEKGLRFLAEAELVVKVVDMLLSYAVFEKASDVHIEPQEKSVVVRYRVDGFLGDVMTLPRLIQPAVVARIKVLANLQVGEHRLPQSGRFVFHKDEHGFSLRVSTVPVFDGEKIEIRLLDESIKPMTMQELGFLPSQLGVVERNIKKSSGVTLVVGPVGSGKSTTLYAILNILNTKNLNISTIEDPVEFRIAGANQMQVNEEAGLSFVVGLRALLRQDPNIVMVGEIRERETAGEVMNAGASGYVMLSALSAGSAIEAIDRLLDMGVEPFVLGSSINAVVSRRLVRALCSECKEKIRLGDSRVKDLARQFDIPKMLEILKKENIVGAKVEKLTEVDFYRGKGCHKCGKTGYRGRVGICEVMEMNPRVLESIERRDSFKETETMLEKDGMLMMWQDGFMKSAIGMTTIEEVLKIIKD